MNMPSPSPAVARSELLEKYLREDPTNSNLLADACEAAITAARYERALAHIQAAQALALDPAGWTFRRARLCIAQRDLMQAEALLESLRVDRGDDAVISHDLAFVKFLQRDFAACRQLLGPWLPTGEQADKLIPAEQLAALQVLWLRASHHMHLLDEAWDWVRQRRAAGSLQPAAAGVASLIAIDLDHFQDALALAEMALAEDPGHTEGLVARASVALAQRQPAAARQWLGRALERNPDDGRTWSAIGFASMLERDLPAARAHLERALRAVPGHIGTWHGLGWCRLLQGDGAGALEAFEHALALNRNFAESHGAIGVALALAGNVAEADQALRRAEKLDPGSVTWQYGRALLAGEVANPRQLQELAARLLDRPGPLGGRLSDWLKN